MGSDGIGSDRIRSDQIRSDQINFIHSRVQSTKTLADTAIIRQLLSDNDLVQWLKDS